MPNSEVALRFERGDIEAELTLPISELALGWEKPLSADAAEVVREYGGELGSYVLQHVKPVTPDGRPWAVTVRYVAPIAEEIPDVIVALRLTPPAGAPADRLTLGYDVILRHLITHTAVVTVASDWRGASGESPAILGTLRDTNTELPIDRAWTASSNNSPSGFAAMFRLGALHIAEGTDHLLFLLALLLPAPLAAAGGRWGAYAGAKTAWRRTFKVVTAFTVGHSITLGLGAAGWVHLPSAVVESAIAISIFVSALHALTPIFRGREIYIAGGFGLVHGLAFAATLTEFGLDPFTLAMSLLGFNLGIESVQLAIIVVTMPWLVLLAQTFVYRPFRVIGASLTGVAAIAWFAERALGWRNFVGPVVERLAAHAPWLLAALAVVSSIVVIATKSRQARGIGLESSRPVSG